MLGCVRQVGTAATGSLGNPKRRLGAGARALARQIGFRACLQIDIRLGEGCMAQKEPGAGPGPSVMQDWTRMLAGATQPASVLVRLGLDDSGRLIRDAKRYLRDPAVGLDRLLQVVPSQL